MHEDAIDTVTSLRTITRSISLPIAECLSHSWQDFCKLLHASWRHSTDLANWASHTLHRQDLTRTPEMKELPPMPTVDLYALAFGRDREKPARKVGKANLPITPQTYDGASFWEGAKIAAATLLRKVHRKYAKERPKIVWRRERRSPEFLYPYPFPVHQQSWVASFTERGQPLLNFALPGGRVSVRLRNGPEFARQLRILHMIVAGDVAQQEISICRQRSHAGDGVGHYRVGEERRQGQRITYRTMLRIACRIPVGPMVDSELVGEIKTGNDPLITLIIPGQEPWLLYANEMRSFIIAHRAFLDRMANDLKFEKRWPTAKRRRMLGRISRGCEKQGRRMRTFYQQLAHMACSHALRNGCGGVRFDTSDRRFLSRDVPWFEMEEHVENKCDELGMFYDEVSSGPVVETDLADNGATNSGSH